MILISLVPLVFGVLATAIISIIYMRSSLMVEQERKLRVALDGYSDNVSVFKGDDIDITVFEGNERVKSSIDGVLHTNADPEVVERVLENGEEYFVEHILVGGTDYYGYYRPIKGGMLFSGIPQSVVQDSINNVIVIVVSVAVGLLVIVGCLSVLISLRISKRMRGVTDGVETLAKGVLDTGLKRIEGVDESIQINNAVVNLASSLNGIVISTKVISNSVSELADEAHTSAKTTLMSCEQIAGAVEEVAKGATEQSITVQDVAMNVGGVNEAMITVNSAIADIDHFSNRVVKSGNEVSERLTSMGDDCKDVGTGIKDVSEQIIATNDTIQQVAGFVSVIEGIANETSLLALNAQIEAARAGESGRGFAVVANTIKALSENTESQVTQINNIIESLVKDFDRCTTTMSHVVAVNEEQVDSLNKVVDAFKELESNIAQTDERVEGIKSVIEDVVTACKDITSSMDDLTGISENSAASTEEISASVQELVALMHTIEEKSIETKEEMNKLIGTINFFS